MRHERLLLVRSVAALDYILMLLLVMYVSYGQQTRLVVWGRTTVVDSEVERKERKVNIVQSAPCICFIAGHINLHSCSTIWNPALW